MTDCSWKNPEQEVEQDGFVTWPEIKPMEYIETHGAMYGYAKEAEPCIYPKCEECAKYARKHCTQPIVLTRQLYELTASKITELTNKTTELENLVYGHLMGDK